MVPVALCELPTVPFAYKRASGAFRTATICQLCEQLLQATKALFGNHANSPRRALDRFWLRAQDHSYTNDISVVTDEPHPLVGADL
jgi:hypothetical protein